MNPNEVVAGFSLLNRWLLYTSMMLAPAEGVAGWGSNCPSNLGFLAYNIYTQVQWFPATRSKQLHALSLLNSHFNIVNAFTFLGGVISGNYFLATLMGFGTAGVMLLNNATGWISWATNQPEGFGIYKFFFFGWRTLSPGWHIKLMLLWQIFDSILSVFMAVLGVGWAFFSAKTSQEFTDSKKERWWWRFPAIPVGAALVLIFNWPLIMWTELLFKANHIESRTDWIAVWLFIAQVGTMMLPSCGL